MLHQIHLKSVASPGQLSRRCFCFFLLPNRVVFFFQWENSTKLKSGKRNEQPSLDLNCWRTTQGCSTQGCSTQVLAVEFSKIEFAQINLCSCGQEEKLRFYSKTGDVAKRMLKTTKLLMPGQRIECSDYVLFWMEQFKTNLIWCYRQKKTEQNFN